MKPGGRRWGFGASLCACMLCVFTRVYACVCVNSNFCVYIVSIINVSFGAFCLLLYLGLKCLSPAISGQISLQV